MTSTNNLVIVGLTGPAGSGKTTAAHYLVKHHNFHHIRFANPLKAMLRGFGLTTSQVDGDKKEVPSPLLCGRTPRYAMQTLGTEWGRNLIGPDLWVNAWRATLPTSGRVVVDDVRFENEANAIRALGGAIILISRSRDSHTDPNHVSERFGFPHDYSIPNHRTKEEFLLYLARCQWGRTPL